MTVSHSKKHFRTAATAAAALSMAATLDATQAQALEVGQCGAPAEMSAALKAEGQKSLINVDRIVVGDVDSVQVFTSNSSGQGYLVEGDQPNGSLSSKFCITLKYQGIELYDSKKNEIPSSALKGGKHDEVLKTSYSNGIRLMMQARTILNGHLSSWVTISADQNDNIGLMLFTDSRNDVKPMSAIKNLKYTDMAKTILQSQSNAPSLKAP